MNNDDQIAEKQVVVPSRVRIDPLSEKEISCITQGGTYVAMNLQAAQLAVVAAGPSGDMLLQVMVPVPGHFGLLAKTLALQPEVYLGLLEPMLRLVLDISRLPVEVREKCVPHTTVYPTRVDPILGRTIDLFAMPDEKPTGHIVGDIVTPAEPDAWEVLAATHELLLPGGDDGPEE